VERELIIAQGTITGAQNHLIPKCRLILQAAHHAFTDHGEAFCLLNDQAIAAQFFLNHKLAKK
jgi:acetoin utilization deacetylase AcuC-like enzyme